MSSEETRTMKVTLGKIWLVLAAGLLLTSGVRSADEGIDYRTLSQPLETESGDKVEVLEFFWYGCPHCYHLEPALDQWLAKQPDHVQFRRVPAVLGRGWVNHARAYFAAELLGVLDKVHVALFEALHEKKLRLFDEDSIADWFAAQGVDREQFLAAYRSFVVDMKVRRVGQLGQQAGLDGVPSFVVNGKYVTSPTQTAGSDRLFPVLDALIAMEAAEQGGEAQPAAE
jgi:thiol:disulfide interchange protein DsbA